MKTRKIITLLLIVLVLTACSKTKLEGNMVLLNQDREEVTFPQASQHCFFHDNLHLNALSKATGPVAQNSR